MNKRVLIVGGFHKAQSLAASLLAMDYGVTAVNSDYQACKALAGIRGLQVIHGDGTRPYVLEDAYAQEADIAIALTQRDDENLVICELCKTMFRVRKTIALVNDARRTDFFCKMGVDSVVCAVSVITGIIEQQAFLEGIATRIPVGEGRIRIAEVPIPGTAPVVGKRIWEINLPKEAIIGCILRGDRGIIPRGDTAIRAGDMLVLISASNQEMEAVKELTGRMDL